MIVFDAILLSFLVASAVAVCAMKSLMASVIIFSAYSVVKSIVWILLSAPDLAITEAAVSTGISGILFFIVLKRVLVVRREYEEQAEYKSPHRKALEKGKFRYFYNALSVAIGLGLTGVLTYTVSRLPPFGDPSNPTNNEVPRKFIEDGIQDSGALNVVASMLFEYRAFDTLGEAAVLIAAVCAVLILLRNDGGLNTFHAFRRDLEDPKQDIILKNMSFLLVGVILVFGAFVVMNGHLSPGGGFSGGAILGAGLILYVVTFGTTQAYKFLNYKTCSYVLSFSLLFYIVVKGYSFFTGANQIGYKFPLGTPGELFSAGLVMPLNISVGLIVACSMYMIYILFSKGVLK
jgi:multicomponent Na+:H+ antiporter subunit B